MDLQGGDVRQEVVADEEAQEDEVVDHALEVVAAGDRREVGVAELAVEVLAERPDL